MFAGRQGGLCISACPARPVLSYQCRRFQNVRRVDPVALQLSDDTGYDQSVSSPLGL